MVAEIAELLEYTIVGIRDANPNIQQLLTYTVNSPTESEGTQQGVIGIGNNAIRKKIAETYRYDYINLIHPAANISKYATFDVGIVVMAGATVNASVKVGRHCIINTNASIDHDCIIGDFVHISPNVALGGDVRVGEGTHVGIGACVIQGIVIGKGCTIGAGTVIIRNVPDGAIVVGNPGRIINNIK